jgi:hypothetical protein
VVAGAAALANAAASATLAFERQQRTRLTVLQHLSSRTLTQFEVLVAVQCESLASRTPALGHMSFDELCGVLDSLVASGHVLRLEASDSNHPAGKSRQVQEEEWKRAFQDPLAVQQKARQEREKAEHAALAKLHKQRAEKESESESESASDDDSDDPDHEANPAEAAAKVAKKAAQAAARAAAKVKAAAAAAAVAIAAAAAVAGAAVAMAAVAEAMKAAGVQNEDGGGGGGSKNLQWMDRGNVKNKTPRAALFRRNPDSARPLKFRKGWRSSSGQDELAVAASAAAATGAAHSPGTAPRPLKKAVMASWKSEAASAPATGKAAVAPSDAAMADAGAAQRVEN